MIKLTIGFILDMIIGDPENPLHPVRGIGNLAGKLEGICRNIFKNSLKIAGFIVWILTVGIVFAITFGISTLSSRVNSYFGILVQGIIIYFCISCKGLATEGYKVIKFLKKDDIEGARKQLSYIVGRDTACLSKREIIEAVIETIAENMSDGVIAPLFYAGILGAPSAMVYKAVNTMDSMFGYKNDKYLDFGYFPAKLDDVFNYIPARITGFLIVAASFILKEDYKSSLKIYLRDRYNHTSPNSAHPEAAMAGALGLRLGGAHYYFGKLVEKPTIGDKKKEIEISDVDKTIRILYVSSFMGYIMVVIIRILINNVIG